MTTSLLEIERKYDVAPGDEVPALAGVRGVAATAEPVVQQLVATYFDTSDLRLRSAGITLRRRDGGSDAGWHLKLPVKRGREEVHVDGSDADAPVPDELRALTRAVARDAPLAPVARLETRRTAHRLLDGAGAVLAEVVDDDVTGVLLPEDDRRPPLRWREWEAELVTGDRHLLLDVEQALLDAGATPSSSGSKVGRVLASRRETTGERPWWSTPISAPRRASAGAAVQAHLSAQVDELVRRDPAVRRDVPDSVHKMRVATRRLRSALKTFRPLLDRQVTDPLRAELGWLAGVLGAARDVEVTHARLTELVAAEPPELVLGPVQRRVDLVMRQRYTSAHHEVVAVLDGERYLQLLDRLDALTHTPPFTERAREPAEKVLPALVRHTWRRLDRAMRSAERAEPGATQDGLLHESRKLAKAARYAAESVTPVFGKPAKRFAAAMEDLQDVLGEHQDGVMTRQALRDIGAGSTRSGENGFTFGRLHALEQVRADAAVRRWPQARKAASRGRLRTWLDD
jgi:CHAD domain-containing protein